MLIFLCLFYDFFAGIFVLSYQSDGGTWEHCFNFGSFCLSTFNKNKLDRQLYSTDYTFNWIFSHKVLMHI